MRPAIIAISKDTANVSVGLPATRSTPGGRTRRVGARTNSAKSFMNAKATAIPTPSAMQEWMMRLRSPPDARETTFARRIVVMIVIVLGVSGA